MDGRCNWEQVLVAVAQVGGGVEHRGKVHLHFFAAAAGEERNPLFISIELELVGELLPGDGGRWYVGKGVANVFGVNSILTKEFFFKGKDRQSFRYPLADALHAIL